MCTHTAELTLANVRFWPNADIREVAGPLELWVTDWRDSQYKIGSMERVIRFCVGVMSVALLAACGGGKQRAKIDAALYLTRFAVLRRSAVRPVFEAMGVILNGRGHEIGSDPEW